VEINSSELYQINNDNAHGLGGVEISEIKN
jgi:hypothetical protein